MLLLKDRRQEFSNKKIILHGIGNKRDISNVKSITDYIIQIINSQIRYWR
jgi:hypothetical protein